jgi:16S rRNA (guanine527-N7)-methyltransferase
MDKETSHNVESLIEALKAAAIDVTPDQAELLDRYRQLLWSWNEKINLTRHTTLEKFAGRDILDSMQLARLLEAGERVLDVGTGGGVPGIPLAILRPDLELSVCESTVKKARAVEAMVAELSLTAPVYPSRAEEVLQLTTFNTLVARAVASLRKLLSALAPHWDAFDRLLVIKGPGWVDERAEARHHGLLKGLQLRKAATYQTPQTGAESIILNIWRSDAGDSVE